MKTKTTQATAGSGRGAKRWALSYIDKEGARSLWGNRGGVTCGTKPEAETLRGHVLTNNSASALEQIFGPQFTATLEIVPVTVAEGGRISGAPETLFLPVQLRGDPRWHLIRLADVATLRGATYPQKTDAIAVLVVLDRVARRSPGAGVKITATFGDVGACNKYLAAHPGESVLAEVSGVIVVADSATP